MRFESPDDIDAFASAWVDSEPVDPHPEAPTRKKLTVADIRSIHDYKADKIEFLVSQIIAAGTVTAVAGDSGSGKSTWVSSICSSVERGVRFCDRDVSRRPVLYLDRENPLAVVLHRFGLLGITDSPNFVLWGGWCEEEAPSPAGAAILGWVQACDPKPVIIIDSLAAFIEGDENSAADVRKFFHPLRRLADAGATVIVIIHAGKGESSKIFRGSTDIKAAIDIGYSVTNLGDPSRLELVKVSPFKARFPIIGDMLYRFRDGIGFSLDERPAYESNEDVLTKLIVAHPGVRTAEFYDIAQDRGISRRRTETFVEQCITAGLIQRKTGERNAKFLTWIGVSE